MLPAYRVPQLKNYANKGHRVSQDAPFYSLEYKLHYLNLLNSIVVSNKVSPATASWCPIFQPSAIFVLVSSYLINFCHTQTKQYNKYLYTIDKWPLAGNCCLLVAVAVALVLCYVLFLFTIPPGFMFESNFSFSSLCLLFASLRIKLSLIGNYNPSAIVVII